ncbi:MAG: formate hydrogenlyase, partial [Methanomassiliicoccaceae archaeon]|nr:formate hydrogenlyase [Methanomassiliicoccaceae archaeon]
MAKSYMEKYPRNTAGTLWVMKPVVKALKMLGKTIIHRPVTILYPYEKMWMPENYRGRPGLRFDRCV